MIKNPQYNGPALHNAVHNDDMASFSKMIDESTNFNIPDNNGDTVLHVATRLKKYKMVEALADAGADLNSPNAKGETPLEIAFDMGDAQTIKTLIKAGADVNVKFKDGATLTHKLVESRDQLGLLDFVFENGAKFEQDRRGNTPLHKPIQLASTRKEFASEYTEIALTLIKKVQQAIELFRPNLLRKSPNDIAKKTNNKPVQKAIDDRNHELSTGVAGLSSVIKTMSTHMLATTDASKVAPAKKVSQAVGM